MNYYNYIVYPTGRVFSKYRNKYLKEQDNYNFLGTHNYKSVSLYEDKLCKKYRIHRLLAKVFLPNPDNLPIVDHIDRNTLNNNLSNLRWISRSGNAINSKRKFKNPRHINDYLKFWKMRIRRDNVIIFSKCFSKKKYTLKEIIMIRNEVVYPYYQIKIDD